MTSVARNRPLRVLFLGTGNSARSQIAEKVLNRKGRGRFVAESAGSHPASEVNPYAIETLERHGFFWTGGYPRSVQGLLEENWDFVITVCDRAIFPGQPGSPCSTASERLARLAPSSPRLGRRDLCDSH
jgi:arsenate reductase (thioredoxin)